jgi:hypothetical protein
MRARAFEHAEVGYAPGLELLLDHAVAQHPVLITAGFGHAVSLNGTRRTHMVRLMHALL